MSSQPPGDADPPAPRARPPPLHPLDSPKWRRRTASPSVPSPRMSFRNHDYIATDRVVRRRHLQGCHPTFAVLGLCGMVFLAGVCVPIVDIDAGGANEPAGNATRDYCSPMVCFPSGRGIFNSGAPKQTMVSCLCAGLCCLVGMVLVLLRAGMLLGSQSSPSDETGLGVAWLAVASGCSVSAGVLGAVGASGSPVGAGVVVLWIPAAVFVPYIAALIRAKANSDSNPYLFKSRSSSLVYRDSPQGSARGLQHEEGTTTLSGSTNSSLAATAPAIQPPLPPEPPPGVPDSAQSLVRRPHQVVSWRGTLPADGDEEERSPQSPGSDCPKDRRLSSFALSMRTASDHPEGRRFSRGPDIGRRRSTHTSFGQSSFMISTTESMDDLQQHGSPTLTVQQHSTLRRSPLTPPTANPPSPLSPSGRDELTKTEGGDSQSSSSPERESHGHPLRSAAAAANGTGRSTSPEPSAPPGELEKEGSVGTGMADWRKGSVPEAVALSHRGSVVHIEPELDDGGGSDIGEDTIPLPNSQPLERQESELTVQRVSSLRRNTGKRGSVRFKDPPPNRRDLMDDLRLATELDASPVSSGESSPRIIASPRSPRKLSGGGQLTSDMLHDLEDDSEGQETLAGSHPSAVVPNWLTQSSVGFSSMDSLASPRGIPESDVRRRQSLPPTRMLKDQRRFSTVSMAESELPRHASLKSLVTLTCSETSELSGKLSEKHVIETNVVEKDHLPNGNKLVNDYEILRVLGQGAYSKVKLCRNVRSGESWALKIFKKSLLRNLGRFGGRGAVLATALQKMQQEIAILKKLRHRNLIQLHEVIDDTENDKVILVMEYASRGPVGQVDEASGSLEGRPLTEDRLRHVLGGVVSGLRYLHKCKVLHRDIKPENILVGTDDNAKLSDFGVSHVFSVNSGDMLQRTEGTPAYFAPEAVGGSAHTEFRGAPADVWALGITVYVLAVGKLPFHATDRRHLRDCILKNSPVIPALLSPPLQDLIAKMLKKDPRWRPSLREINYHSFLKPESPSTACIPPRSNFVRPVASAGSLTSEEPRRAPSPRNLAGPPPLPPRKESGSSAQPGEVDGRDTASSVFSGASEPGLRNARDSPPPLIPHQDDVGRVPHVGGDVSLSGSSRALSGARSGSGSGPSVLSDPPRLIADFQGQHQGRSPASVGIAPPPAILRRRSWSGDTLSESPQGSPQRRCRNHSCDSMQSISAFREGSGLRNSPSSQIRSPGDLERLRAPAWKPQPTPLERVLSGSSLPSERWYPDDNSLSEICDAMGFVGQFTDDISDCGDEPEVPVLSDLDVAAAITVIGGGQQSEPSTRTPQSWPSGGLR